MDSKIVKRYEKKSIPDLLKIAQKYFNLYVRLRDQKNGYFICISCNVPKGIEQMHAGHYLSAGHNARTRFDEQNCWGQCIRCNYHLSGNQVGYRIYLVAKIGPDKVAELEQKSRQTVKWDRYSLIDLIETYKEKSKQLSKAA
jgi:hypothetical protein